VTNVETCETNFIQESAAPMADTICGPLSLCLS